MADLEKVEFYAAAWSEIAADDLGRIADVCAEDIHIFAAACEAGEFQLWDVFADKQRIGCVVWSVEKEGRNHALIVNAAAAEPVHGLDVTKAIFEAFHHIAERTGARALRFWTSREGLRRKTERLGFTSRYVMEMKL